MSEEGSAEHGSQKAEVEGLLAQVRRAPPSCLFFFFFFWRAHFCLQLRSTIHVVREETHARLDATKRACEEYAGADYLQYAPAKRVTKVDPTPEKTHEPPPFSNMQIYFLTRKAEELEAARKGGDETATAERLVASLVKVVTAKRNVEDFQWLLDGVDLSPVGHTKHTLKHALAPIVDSFVFSGKIQKREKKEGEEQAANKDDDNGGKPKRGRPKGKRDSPAPAKAAPVAGPVPAVVTGAAKEDSAAAKKKSKK